MRIFTLIFDIRDLYLLSGFHLSFTNAYIVHRNYMKVVLLKIVSVCNNVVAAITAEVRARTDSAAGLKVNRLLYDTLPFYSSSALSSFPMSCSLSTNTDCTHRYMHTLPTYLLLLYKVLSCFYLRSSHSSSPWPCYKQTHLC